MFKNKIVHLTLKLIKSFIITYHMDKKDSKHFKNACPSSQNDEESAQSSFIPLSLLAITDHKESIDLSQAVSCYKDQDSVYQAPSNSIPDIHKNKQRQGKKTKLVQKKEKDHEEEKKQYLNRKRRVAHLQSKVEQLQREVLSLRRNQHQCRNCRQRSLDYYQGKITQLIHPEDPTPGMAGPLKSQRSSEGSLEFEKIDFHMPLMQTQEMEEKMWIFLGTMLIAMGSKVMDFDGTINTFKVLKSSVDRVRRQVEKGEPLLGLNFFCSKEEMHEPGALLDGMSFDPFYNSKQDPTTGHFNLEGVKIESVEEYELFYDYKYDFNIKYDALLSIMEYARDNCTLS